MAFRVSVTELTTRAEQLRNLNGQFKTAVSQLEETEQSLMGMWEGAAQKTFHNAFQTDKGQMANFYNAIELYAAKLEEIASKYAETENLNVETASTRTYK